MKRYEVRYVGWQLLLAITIAGCGGLRIDPTGQYIFIYNEPGPGYPPPVRPGPVAPAPFVPGPLIPAPTPAQGVTLRMAGPSQASIGSTATYRLEVINSSDRPVANVLVTDQPPPGLVFLNSNPPTDAGSSAVQWRFGQMPARGTQVIEANFRVDTAGALNHCATVQTGAGATTRNCVVTSVQSASAPSASLNVRVTNPSRAEVGSDVQFVIEVTNRSDVPATGLVINDVFDAGLEHPVSQSPIQRELETLAPGESRRIGVTFRITRPGRLCHTVEVTGEGGSRATAAACVDASSPIGAGPPLTIRLIGPRQLEVGGVAEFKIELTNNSQAPLARLVLTDSFDAALEPRQATTGYTQDRNQLVWEIPTIAPGETVRRQVHFECMTVAARACNRAIATANGRTLSSTEACVEIIPKAAAGPATEPTLTIDVADRVDPVKVNGQTTYEIRITNAGRVAAQQVALRATVPPQMRIEDVRSSVQTRTTGQTIDFSPIAEMRAGESISFELRARALQSGDARLTAEVTSRGLSRPVRTEESTRIFAD